MWSFPSLCMQASHDGKVFSVGTTKGQNVRKSRIEEGNLMMTLRLTKCVLNLPCLFVPNRCINILAESEEN